MTTEANKIRLEIQSILGRELSALESSHFIEARGIGLSNPTGILRFIHRRIKLLLSDWQAQESEFYSVPLSEQDAIIALMSQQTRDALFNLIDMRAAIIRAENERKESGK